MSRLAQDTLQRMLDASAVNGWSTNLVKRALRLAAQANHGPLDASIASLTGANVLDDLASLASAASIPRS